MELEEGRAALEDEDGNGTKSDLETAKPLSCPETSGSPAKDHCDSLLDAIDAQLSRLQWQGPRAGVAGGRTNGGSSLECSPNASWTTEMEGCCANQDGTSNPSRKEEYGWRLRHLLGCEQAPENLGDQSDSNSVCTEDFAARFREGMVDPLGNSDGEGDVPAGGFPARDSAEEGCITGITATTAGLPPAAGQKCESAAKGFPLSTARRQHSLQWSEEGPEGDVPLALSSRVEGPQSLSSRTRRESLESLGGRISRLSQGNTRDTPSSMDLGKADSAGSRAPGLAPPEWVETWEESVPWPLQQGVEGLEGSSRWVQDSQENSRPFSSTVLVEGLDPSRPLRASGPRAWASESQSARTALSPSGRREPPGRSTKGPHCPRRDSLGCLGSSSAVTDEEEEEEEEEFLWSRDSAERRSSSPARWSSVPSRAEPRKEACVEHKDLGAEEERLVQRKSQLHEADVSLSDILGQKKRTVQELESLRGALERSQKEAETLESCLKETRSKADEANYQGSDLLLLHRRDSCLEELPELEKELSVLRCQHSTLPSTHLGAFQAKVSSLVAEREELKARVRHLEGSLSELECQLSCCKAELFSEQRAARARIEELQECLEEAQKKLEERMAEGTELQEETTRLRLQLRELEGVRDAQVQEQAAALSRQIQDLQVRETEQELRRCALEKILSEKELELVRLQEVVCALTAEKEAQQHAMENQSEEHDRQLGKMQQEKELEWAQQREKLQRLKQQELQEFAESLEQVKARALQHQAASFQKEVENLTRVIKARDEAIRSQQEAVQRQEESTQQLVRELKQEAKETVQSALLQEQRKWEAEKREALQVQRGMLEEQSQRAHAEALDKERRTVSVWQTKTLEFQKRIQELELHGRSLQREKQEALDELRTLLQEEKTEALRRLQEEMEQEKARESDQLRAKLQQLEEEQSHLLAEQSEMSIREREAQSQAERAERALAREIGLACQRLQDLLPERARGQMAHGNPAPLSISRSLQLLQGASEETQCYLGALQQELDTQKRAALHFQQEKERELRQQREQLDLERKEALEALKERLVQEQLQEIRSLRRSQVKEAGGGEQQTLHQPLRENDNELQARPRSMAHRKDQTACQLAGKCEEELNAELETCFSRDRPRGRRRRVEKRDAEIGRLSMDRSERTHLCPTQLSSFLRLELLRRLQGRVRELQAENAIYPGGSREDLTALRVEPGQMSREKFHGASCRK